MATPRVALGHNVEEERLNVVIQGLVVQEQLGQQAQVLAVDFLLLAVDLEDRERVVAIDFVAGRVAQIALELSASQTLPRRHRESAK